MAGPCRPQTWQRHKEDRFRPDGRVEPKNPRVSAGTLAGGRVRAGTVSSTDGRRSDAVASALAHIYTDDRREHNLNVDARRADDPAGV